MSKVINGARERGVSGPLEGVTPIETNLPGSEQVRKYAIEVAKRINGRTNDWLKRHTMFFPGAGMGSWFRNIDDGGSAFWTDIAGQVKYFSFIYKFMPSQDGDVCENLYEYYHEGDTRWNVRLGENADMAGQREYLDGTLGFDDLRGYLRSADDAQLANVIFWGDSGDGIIQMTRTNAQLVHQLLVAELDQPGYFLDFAIIEADHEERERSKHILVSEPGSVERNTQNAWEERGPNDQMTVWDEWHAWRLDDPGY
jgi:hypothetical protein